MRRMGIGGRGRKVVGALEIDGGGGVSALTGKGKKG